MFRWRRDHGWCRAAGTAHAAALTQIERRLPWWPIERIERIQGRRVRSMVRHAYESVPFYREEMRRLGLTPADFQARAATWRSCR